MIGFKRARFLLILLFAGAFCVFGWFSKGTKAAEDEHKKHGDFPSFLVSPSNSAFSIDETFDVNLAINTGNQTVNAFKIKLLFPPDKLQVVSSSTGKSITGFWIRRPTYSNELGVIDLEGAIPSPGINTSFGIISTVTFRARSLGTATIRFDSESALFLNDGQGTQVNVLFQNGLFKLVLPAPQGPVITSPTHPDQNKWYNVNDVILRWANTNPVQGYSYILNKSPTDQPDNISEGNVTEALYKALGDGIHYFHIKALREGVWGGVSHYGLKVQTSSPAKFTIDASPGTYTSSKTVVFSFETTDQISGLNRYEAKVIRLDPELKSLEKESEPFFFETKSPYILKADDYGKYEFIVRAFNHAGNYTETSIKVSIVKPLFQFIASDGLKFGDYFTIPWYIFWLMALIVLFTLGYLAYHVYIWHRNVDTTHRENAERNESNRDILGQLKERFGGLRSIVFILVASISILGLSLTPVVRAASEIPPPVTNLVSENINNDEIFYIGGRAVSGSGGQVVVYLESLSTGETFSFETPVSPAGDWFYTHPSFLQSGNYLLWTQLKIADRASPPSSQIQLSVSPKAIQLGASRLSYETVYLILLSIFIVIIAGLGSFTVYYWKKGRQKYQNLTREIKEAEEAIIQGFALLRRDVQSELEFIRKLKMAKELSNEEHVKEQQLLNHLDEISKHIEKEVWDIEKVLG